MAGKLTGQELFDLIGSRVERFRACAPMTDEWRQIARALCVAEYEALSRIAERDEGYLTGKPPPPAGERKISSAHPAACSPEDSFQRRHRESPSPQQASERHTPMPKRPHAPDQIRGSFRREKSHEEKPTGLARLFANWA